MSGSERRAVLHPARERSLERRHPWIFSGAIAHLPPDLAPGELLDVYRSDGQWLALAYFHPQNSIAGRVVSFEMRSIDEVLTRSIRSAALQRSQLFGHETNAYRLINAEGDGLPGLVIDRYANAFVVQITTYGMERLKVRIVEILVEQFAPQGIYEKSRGPARSLEGLTPMEGVLYGDCPELIEIRENSRKFFISVAKGQKTGFFLDQREMRTLVGQYASGKRVLDCFSYSGGFAISALTNGAVWVESVDVCEKACKLVMMHLTANGCDPARYRGHCQDVFSFLASSDQQYDFVILDPPAFAKKRRDVENACRAYKRLITHALTRLKKGGLLLTCSCSYFIDEALFIQLASQACVEVNTSAVILARHLQAPDHPISLHHPEGHYLKSLLLRVNA